MQSNPSAGSAAENVGDATDPVDGNDRVAGSDENIHRNEP
jgi:hypothetical protein